MRFASLVVLCLLLGAGVAIGGFLKFAEDIAAMAPPRDVAAVDAIVVLTGGAQRIDEAMSLFNRGVGKRVLISGVNPATTGRQIMNFTEGSDALFECCVDIGHDAIDTIGNANETARWISRHEFDHVLVVTNDYHIPRSLLELRHVDPETTFTAYPVALPGLKSENWLTRPDVMRILINEYAKYTWAWVRQAAGASVPSGLRTDLAPPAEGLVQAEMQ
jgi:uncharacterized SAM-binding protein YcdF (DUF218 family)